MRPLVSSVHCPLRWGRLRQAPFSWAHHRKARRSAENCTATEQHEQHGNAALPSSSSSPCNAQHPSPSPPSDDERRARAASPSTNGSGGDPEDEPSTGVSFQFRLDPFSQQLIMSALTAGTAAAIAALAHVDLSSSLRLEGGALVSAAQLSAPVLLFLLAVVAPRWALPFKGTELERLRHNYYMTAQVLQLYLNFGDDDSPDDSGGGAGSGSGASSTSGGEERARVRRRLRLEQTVGWGTVSSGLALMQAYTLQPWNPPTANAEFALGLAGRTAQQLANEFLIRGAGWGLLSGWVAGALSEADASDGILFFGKVFGGPEAIKYVGGLGLVALALPGALWEARAARNFVRASIVGPVRDAAIFCTGNGVDEPAYCDPRGFAMMAARRPANAAPVADVVTRTRGWRSGPESSFSSVSSLASMDTADLPPLAAGGGGGDGGAPDAASTAAAAAASSSSVETGSATSSPPSESQAQTSPRSPEIHSGDSPPAAPSPSSSSSSSCPSSSGPPCPFEASRGSDSGGDRRPGEGGTGGGSGGEARAPLSPPPPPSPPPLKQAAAPSLPREGPALSSASTAFEWDSEDMAVLLRVETLQDRIAFWSALYYQLLSAFAINGAFLASDGNLLASLAAAWLLRTGPLLLAELRARAAAGAAAQPG